ncbi:ubiquinone biosynthesis O-methyltransferase, mitochondrial isoform X2 [Betta splendens]|uniref:Ubiquinone biosynthesis O-methyltransferase, mitochondrial isoform X2 n=1 Tax=Betta splendens TaxID=158456 RepID=A0A9W2XB13_BETSP|nr:ubiquinone biosynthesis O-methyltransferase, mitochondrial isoform X2 [Betta splendens]
MLSQLGRLVSGRYHYKRSVSCGMFREAAGRSWFSCGALCKRRSQLQRNACLEMKQRVVPCQISSRSASRTTVDHDELKKFWSLASKWWDEHGEFSALHALNDLRVSFIRDNLLNVHRARHPGKPLLGLRILDVGCGGGLLTEPLGRLGANVLGIDPVEDSIGTAQLHASHDPDLCDRISYQACTVEELSAEVEGGEEECRFDAIVASEVVEHLADLETFAFCCSHMLKMVSLCSLSKECSTTQCPEPGAGPTALPSTTPCTPSNRGSVRSRTGLSTAAPDQRSAQLSHSSTEFTAAVQLMGFSVELQPPVVVALKTG